MLKKQVFLIQNILSWLSQFFIHRINIKIMFKQFTQRLTPARRVPGVLALFIVLFVLLVAVAGCNKEPIHPKEKCNASMTPGPAQLLVSGLQGSAGSTIGPDGALYVTEGAVGKITRIDPKTGNAATFASGLPLLIPGVGIGGAWDVAFVDKTAYVLVTLVGTDVGGSDVVGIYRRDGPDSYTVIADIGAFSIANPPAPAFVVPTGVQYAIQTYHGGFLVTDGHHNRLLYVELDGKITEVKTFEDIVPTGLALSGSTIYMAEAGPVPHNPEDGRVVSFGPKSPAVTTVASGARLVVDVEFNCGHTLYALSQGVWDGVDEGSPALPNTGSLVKVNNDGTFTVVKDGLDRPTSLEFIGTTAYIVTLTGEVWTIKHVSGALFDE